VLVCDLSSPKIYSALIGVSKLVWYFFTTSVCGLKVRGRSLQNWFGPTDGGGSWRFPKIKGKIYLSSPPRQNAWRKDKSSVHWWFTAASQRHQQNIYKQYFLKKWEIRSILHCSGWSWHTTNRFECGPTNTQ
jgi:hypothetical protein